MIKDFYKYFLAYIFILFTACYSFSDDKNGNGVYEIDEIKIVFKQISFFDEEQIKQILASIDGHDFDYGVFLQDIERIKKYYFDNGFFDTVVDTSLYFEHSDKEVIVKFIISENTRYQYNIIDYEGLDDLDENVKDKIFSAGNRKLLVARFYSKDTIKLEVNRIMNILYNNGYANASSDNPVILKYETNQENLLDKVKVILNFQSGDKFIFGTTSVTFPAKRYNVTKEDLLRELTYKKNQIYNKEEVVNSEINLSKISLIENPRINIVKVDSVEKKIDLGITALIRNKYEFTPEVFGYYFQQLFYVGTGISFSDNNFLGGGRVLTSSLRFYFHSFNDNRIEFVNTVFQPFLFGKRNISGNWNIGAEFRFYDIGKINQIKNSFGVSFGLPSYTYLNRLNLKWEVINSNLVIKANTLLLEDFKYNYFTSTLNLDAIHNTANDIKFPFEGNYQSYSIEEGGLLSGIVRKIFNTNTLSYVKLSNFNSVYYNLTNQKTNVGSVLAAKFSTGVIIEYGDNSFLINGIKVNTDRVPNDKKFVCGGSSSIRGWGANQLGIVLNKTIGGNFIIETSVEQRLRPFLSAENAYFRDLGFAAFIDAGNAWSEIGKFKFNEIALATGAGLRYYTIIGAIRVDIGFKVYDPQPGPVGGSNWIFAPGCNFNDKYNFQFGIGNTF